MKRQDFRTLTRILVNLDSWKSPLGYLWILIHFGRGRLPSVYFKCEKTDHFKNMEYFQISSHPSPSENYVPCVFENLLADPLWCCFVFLAQMLFWFLCKILRSPNCGKYRKVLGGAITEVIIHRKCTNRRSRLFSETFSNHYWQIEHFCRKFVSE